MSIFPECRKTNKPMYLRKHKSVHKRKLDLKWEFPRSTPSFEETGQIITFNHHFCANFAIKNSSVEFNFIGVSCKTVKTLPLLWLSMLSKCEREIDHFFKQKLTGSMISYSTHHKDSSECRVLYASPIYHNTHKTHQPY